MNTKEVMYSTTEETILVRETGWFSEIWEAEWLKLWTRMMDQHKDTSTKYMYRPKESNQNRTKNWENKSKEDTLAEN